jgi:hypothetical protein
LKSWRYVGVYGPELMLCIGAVRIGPARQAFWAVWDRSEGRLYERTVMGRGGVALARGRARVLDRELELDLTLEEVAGIEAISPSGASYGWTRKQGGIRAFGTIRLGRSERAVDARAVIDDTAAYYARRTAWRWSAGVGVDPDGRRLAWNLVDGVNDPPHDSERTMWVDGVPCEVGPCAFADDLATVDGLHFASEAVRTRRENLVLVQSVYRQPFGVFSGELPGAVVLAEGYGVMEAHEALW